MKKIMLCMIVLAFSSLLLHGAQSPHKSGDSKPAKHVVKNDNELLNILQQTRRRQQEDPKRKRLFDTDPIQHTENKKG